jgi:hypothetical protein
MADFNRAIELRPEAGWIAVERGDRLMISWSKRWLTSTWPSSCGRKPPGSLPTRRKRNV